MLIGDEDIKVKESPIGKLTTEDLDLKIEKMKRNQDILMGLVIGLIVLTLLKK
jgi:tetrahydromethanopterin S-methyltransferase subunit G